MPLFTKVRPINASDLEEMGGDRGSCFGEGCTALVTHAVSGEEDSFGIEWNYGCLKHCNEARETNNKPYTGNCDWCKDHRNSLRPHRDFEEGSSGRVYDVCLECRQEESKRVSEELAAEEARMGKDTEDFDDYDYSDRPDDMDDEYEIEEDVL